MGAAIAEASPSKFLSEISSFGLPEWMTTFHDGDDDDMNDDDEDERLDIDATVDRADDKEGEEVHSVASAGVSSGEPLLRSEDLDQKRQQDEEEIDHEEDKKSDVLDLELESQETGGLLGIALSDHLEDIIGDLGSSLEKDGEQGGEGTNFDKTLELGSWSREAEDGDDESDGRLSVADRQALESAELMQSLDQGDASSGEDSNEDGESAGATVETSTPVFRGETRYDGSQMILAPQVQLPRKPMVKTYNSKKNFWPWYGILRKRGWMTRTTAEGSNAGATLLLSRGKVPYIKQGKQMLNSIGVSGCIGGTKLMQLSCRRRLAEHHGCTYEDLRIQPAQYNLDVKASCEALFVAASRPENLEKLWLWKPSTTFHGMGIKVLRGLADLKAQVGSCQSPKAVIVMEYVAEPATMQGGYKFDLRTYLLVGSLDPQLVFFADGFVRKSDTRYSRDTKNTKVHVTNAGSQSKVNHFFSFDEMAEELSREMDFPPEYLARAREYMKKVSLYVFKTTDVQNKKLKRVPGRFHLFAIDWLIDKLGNVHLLEGNGYPLVTEYPVKGLTPEIWEELLDLVLKIHVTPHELPTTMTVKDGFTFGKWSLIYNDLEEKYNGDPFSPCYMFPAPSLLEDPKARRTQRRN
ncbi:Tubulin polyglutamylase TTLL7 [Hondaea fermentalgiana]|uniref:Tubulin--tyrosine ligase-like protein 9 n=1 Tax=Hondaea fermentalgiana TaxID=2315210 RepID=A0A2R5GUN8_9STRA|nr:Tubulin polyglutamylase TTLL7 [Hondaea fermentalgiana]|eukprot:GBG34572.1 Tubulin polyglutamylase TTLL7 [Hondaea fermentalgiana]